MSVHNGAQRASRWGFVRPPFVAIMVALVVALTSAATPGPVAAAGPRVAIIVGPAGSRTATNKDWGNAAAAEALRYTSNVVKVYSPRATWSRVKNAITGASVVVYIGRGYGYPSPRSSKFKPGVQDGFGLNPVSGVDNKATKYYGEAYIRDVPLAPNAIVLLSHVAYAPGTGEPGAKQPSLSVARRRVDNYAAGFLAADAAVVIAEYASRPTYYIRALFTQDTTLGDVWRHAPSFNGHVSSFTSTRTDGAVGRTDPERKGAGFYRSIAGWPSTRTFGSVPAPPPGPSLTVPASIDASCGTAVSSELNAWIKAQPDGSTLVFPPGSCYRLGGDAGLDLSNRNGLTLVGTGSALQLRTTGASNFSSAFFFQNSHHVTIRGFAVDGGNTATGTTGAWDVVNERKNAAAVRAGSSYIEFDHVSWDRLYGFGVFIGADGGSVWPSDISIHDSVIRGGEAGVAIVAGRRLRIVGNAINDSVGVAIDLEPDSSQPGPNGEPGYGGGFEDVLIADNDVTRYGWIGTATTWFVAANPQDAVVDTAVMDGLTITGNRVHVGAATGNNGNADGLGGLGIRADKGNLKRDFVITDNWTADDDVQSSSRAVMYFTNVRNLAVTGNRQPISNGARLVGDSGTSGTRTVSGNDVSPP